MKFLPYENFYIITHLKPEEVQLNLEKEVSAGNGSFFKNPFNSTSDTYFEGYAVNGIFNFKRTINYRNSFLPEIKGSTEKWIDGSRLHIRMSMIKGITAFMCIWLGFALLFCFGFLIQETNKGPFKVVDIAPFGMFLCGYLLTMGGFKYESRKAKDKLIELLNGEIA